MNLNAKLKGIVLLIATVIGLNAQAGILVEPYLGLGFAGNGHYKEGTTRTDINYNLAPVAGLRAGYSKWNFTLGLDATYLKATLSNQYLTGNTINTIQDRKISKSQAGVFLAYNLSIPMRVWGTYYFTGSMDYNSSSEKYNSGTGYGFGGSYTGLPIVAINLEYRVIKYSEHTSAAGVTGGADCRLGEMLLSASVPFDFDIF